MFKFWHLVVLLVIIYAAIWSSNNITFVENIVG